MKNLTVREENFCIKFVECNNKSEAYRFAYSHKNMKPSTLHHKACTVSSREHVKARIEQLRQEQRERLNLSTDNMVKQLTDLIEQAKEAKQFNAAINALALIIKVLDLYKKPDDKQEHQPMVIQFDVKPPVSRDDIKVTKQEYNNEWEKIAKPQQEKLLADVRK